MYSIHISGVLDALSTYLYYISDNNEFQYLRFKNVCIIYINFINVTMKLAFGLQIYGINLLFLTMTETYEENVLSKILRLHLLAKRSIKKVCEQG